MLERKRWKVAVLAVLGVYAAVVVLARFSSRVLLFPAPPGGDAVPAGARLLELVAEDGARAHALEFPARGGGAPGAAPTLVHFHGNGEVASNATWLAEALAARGVHVVLAEYRGYGLSRASGPPSEEGLYADAEAVLDALARGGRGPERVTLFGQSLGSGVAAEMASRGRGRALVLVTPFTSIPAMAWALAPAFPPEWVVRDRFDTLSKARRIRSPALVVHGDRDELVPFSMGEAVASALDGARLVRVEGGSHGDLLGRAGDPLLDEIARLAKGG